MSAKYLLSPIIILSAAISSASPILDTLWATDVHMFLESGPTVADLDSDGTAEIIVAARESVIILNGDGTERTRWTSAARLMTYPAVLSRSNEPALLYVADIAGTLTCLEATGTVRWQSKLSGPASWSCAAITKIENVDTVIQCDDTGAVYCFDALTGVTRWQAKVSALPTSPAIADLDSDGQPEIVVATGTGKLHLLSSAGTIRKEIEIGKPTESWGTCAPVIFTAQDGSKRIAVGNSDGVLTCFDKNLEFMWRQSLEGPIASGLSVGDMDLDGRADIFVVTQRGHVYRLREDGALLWDVDTQVRSLAAGAIIDLNGDNSMEYVLATQQGRLLVLDAHTRPLFDRQLDHRTINVTPAFGDLDPARPGLEMAITGGESGKILSFATSATPGPTTQWAAYRGNEQKTGASVVAAPAQSVVMTPDVTDASKIFTDATIRFSIKAPGNSEVIDAVATCESPDGAIVSAHSSVLGETGVLELRFRVRAAGRYRLTWNARNAQGHTVATGSAKHTLEPFKNDLAFVQESINIIRPVYANEADVREEETKQLASDLANVDDARIDQFAALVAHLRHLRNLAQINDRAKHDEIFVVEAPLWDSRLTNPSELIRCNQLSRTVVRGEHEPISLRLFNLDTMASSVTLAIDRDATAPTVTVHHSKRVTDATGAASWDPLPRFEVSGAIGIAGLASEELWLDIDTTGVREGVYNLTLSVTPATVTAVHAIPLTITVLPFDMAPANSIRVCAWANQTPEAIKDMLAHGNNVFIGPHAELTVDANGAITTCSFEKLDILLDQLTNTDAFILLSGYPPLPAEFGSEPYQRQLADYMNRLREHHQKKGYATDRFALYPVDEPMVHALHLVEHLAEFGKLLEAAAPDIMLYVDGDGELPMYEMLAPFLDVWTPGVHVLAENSPRMDIMRNRGKLLWSYDCFYHYTRPSGVLLKNCNIVGQYRTAALYALRHGATGIGFWCYNHGEDMWGQAKLEYPLVYTNESGITTTRRWEAVREGIEDYRIAIALREAAAKLGTSPKEIATKARIDALLNDALPAMVDPSRTAAMRGMARYVLDEYGNDNTMNAFREELLACVEELTR